MRSTFYVVTRLVDIMTIDFDKELNESVNAPEKATSITEIPENTEDHEECKRKPFLLRVNWRNAMAILCLNVAYCMCSGAYSMMGPFFPEQVWLPRMHVARYNNVIVNFSTVRMKANA